MHNTRCDLSGIEVPIFASSQSPKVVAQVSNAGGFGVLGANRMDPEELDTALQLIAQEGHGTAFGIDLLIPERYMGSEEGRLALETLQQPIPRGIVISSKDCSTCIMFQHFLPGTPSCAPCFRRGLASPSLTSRAHSWVKWPLPIPSRSL